MEGRFYGSSNYEIDLFTTLYEFLSNDDLGIKDYFGFVRFYASGAAVLRVLDLLGATGVDQKVQDGKPPVEVLIEHLGVTPTEVDSLVADARVAYDPQDEIATSAARAAAAAEKEGPVFGAAAGKEPCRSITLRS